MSRAGAQQPMASITLVAAMARGRVIGRKGSMPWHLPADLRHFKALTLGHPVIMGRRTFDSIGRALPDRTNVVISRSRRRWPAGVCAVECLELALAKAGPSGPVMVIGGGQVYARALPLAQRMELTLIDADIEGDTLFPAFRWSDWQVESLRSRPPDERNPYRLNFVCLRRQQPEREL